MRCTAIDSVDLFTKLQNVILFSMNIDSKVLNELQTFLIKHPQVIVGYFYGSRAHGYEIKTSDLDLAVVVKDEQIDYGNFYLKTSQIFRHFDLDLRIVTLKNSPTFLFQVINGQCVYKKSDQEKLIFETKVLQYFYDSQHIRDIYDHYLRQAFKEG